MAVAGSTPPGQPPIATPRPRPFAVAVPRCCHNGCARSASSVSLQSDPRPRGAVGPRVAFDHAVLESKLDRVESEFAAKLVHRRLDRVGALLRSRRAVRPRGGLVGEHFVPADIEVGHPVVAAHQDRSDLQWRSGKRARVENDVALECGQSAVAGRPKLELDPAIRRRIAADEILHPGVLEQHRPFGGYRHRGDERLDQHELAAEPTSDRHRVDVDSMDRNTDGLGNTVAAVERRLSTGIDVDIAERRDVDQTRLRFDVSLMNRF